MRLTEHEYMGPKLTQAEGFILGIGAKMFTIAEPAVATLYHEKARWELPNRLCLFQYKFIILG